MVSLADQVEAEDGWFNLVSTSDASWSRVSISHGRSSHLGPVSSRVLTVNYYIGHSKPHR